jgi:Lrp/AsnC family transcriptional regulator, leucine-responsive regulatory protein
VDALDRKALPLLMKDARVTWSELGHELGLSAPAAAERVRKLEDQGIIRGYSAILNAEALGYSLTAFVFVTLTDQRRRTAFHNGVKRLDQIVECHHVAGDDDFLLKIRCRGTRDLDRLLVDELKGKMGVARSRTTVVLDTAKETSAVPVDVEAR